MYYFNFLIIIVIVFIDIATDCVSFELTNLHKTIKFINHVCEFYYYQLRPLVNAMTNDNQFVLNTHSSVYSLNELNPFYKSVYKTRNSFINSQTRST